MRPGPKPTFAALHAEILAAGHPDRARLLARFFKTGAGQYGEGDVFLGLTVPASRVIAGRFRGLPLAGILKALRSKFHEERLIALLLLVERYQRRDDGKKRGAEAADVAARRECFDFYLAHAERVNNWDLVDLSSHHVVGDRIVRGEASADVLPKLARSENLWRRRIAIVSTFALIRAGRLRETFRIADLLLGDRHDLIHKAVGWMLREAGKKDHAALVAYLAPRYKTMPRTMLRYAIEKFPEVGRKRYLAGAV